MRTDRRFFYANTIAAVIEQFSVVDSVTKPICNFEEKTSPEHIVWMAMQVAYLNVHEEQNAKTASMWVKQIHKCMKAAGFWSVTEAEQLLRQDRHDGFNHHVNIKG